MVAEKPPINLHDKQQSARKFNDLNASTTPNSVVLELRRTIQINLLNYQEKYRKTGQVDFIPFEIVAKMAAEGRVFVPDHAEQEIQQIIAAAEGARIAATGLQSTLRNLAGHQERRAIALEQLEQFSEESITLIALVEQDVLPIADLVTAGKRLELDGVLNGIETLVANFVEGLEWIVVATATRTNTENQLLQEIVDELTPFVSATQLVETEAVKIIKARVPFYHLSA